jgi:RimJ/RimL family protein N-acetyltransferase
MAASDRRLSSSGQGSNASYELRLVPLPIGVARQMLAGKLRRPQPDSRRAQLESLRPEPPSLRPERGGLRPEPPSVRPDPGSLCPEPVEGQRLRWHPEYPLPDSIDAISMVVAAHRATAGRTEDSPAWWIHQIVVDGVVVGDIGFHGPPDGDRAVEIGYSVVPGWRRRGVATRACALILQQAWQDGAEIVVAETDHDNAASQAVLLRNGFQRRPDGVFMINRPEAR